MVNDDAATSIRSSIKYQIYLKEKGTTCKRKGGWVMHFNPDPMAVTSHEPDFFSICSVCDGILLSVTTLTI